MSTQHTPGPWFVVQDVKARNYMAGQCGFLKWENGQPARFGTEALARAAIAKATGSAS